MEYNIYSSSIENNTLSKMNKTYSIQGEQQKNQNMIPENLKIPIQLLEQNNYEKFN